MSKIIVPQEQKDKIINLYVNEHKTRKEIKKILNLPFGDSVIKRILIENNIEIRTNAGAQKGGRKKQEVDINLQKEIINLYINKQYGLDKIVKILNLPFSFDKVRSILKDNGIHIRDIKEANSITTQRVNYRKYTINDNYCLETHNGMWLLGFFAADGYLPSTKGARNKIVIELASKDKEILERIKKELEYSGPIYEYLQQLDDMSYPKATLSMTSKKLRQSIESYGITNQKTYLLNSIPDIPSEFKLDFIRGYLDGDGWISKKRNGPVLGITSYSKNFVVEINQILHELLPLKYKGCIAQDHNNWSITWGKYDSIIIGKALYRNDYLALKRKKDKFLLLENSSQEPKTPKR